MKATRAGAMGAIAVATALLATALSSAQAFAGEFKAAVTAPDDNRWRAECGSCHLAYPPRLLPARSWLAIVDGLDEHFGSDVSLDAPTASAIRAFLTNNAGRDTSPSASPVLRITQTRRFVHEHREIAANVWRREKVGSVANCAACHANAESGNFSEHDVRIPR